MERQVIAFNRKKILCENENICTLTVNRVNSLQTLVSEFGRFGIQFTSEVLERISESEIKEYMDQVLPILIKKYHDDFGVDFKPLWPGFPHQVKNLDESLLKLVQQQIYDKSLSYDDPIFNYKDEDEGSASSTVIKDPVVISLMTVEDFTKIPGIICGSGTAISEITMEELDWFLENHPEYPLPEKIPFKEILVHVMSKNKNYVPSEITDVLRYAFYQMGGSAELDSKTKDKTPIKSPSRSLRREILRLLDSVVRKNGISNCIIDGKRHVGKWLLVIKRLHAVDYAKRYPEAYNFAKLFTEDRKYFLTWNSHIRTMYDTNKDIRDIAKEISKRPGEFIRRLDSLVRRYQKDGRDVSELLTLIRHLKGTSNKTIVEILKYYSMRDETYDRIVRLKDKTQISIPSLPAHSSDLVKSIRSEFTVLLLNNISAKYSGESLKGKVVRLDPAIADIPIPSDMRKSTIPTGTSFNIPSEVKFMRFFCHWIQLPGTMEDIDLHAVFFSEDFTRYRSVGWNGTAKGVFGVYSGDVRHREGKCSEYVDINIDKAVAKNYRYVLMDVYNYSNRGLDSLPCWFGYTYMSEMPKKTSLTWNPSEPTFMTKTETPCCRVVAWIFDLVERKAFMADIALNGFIEPDNTDLNKSIVSRVLKQGSVVNSLDILNEAYKSQGATTIMDIDDIDFESDVEVAEVITKDDVLSDYTKILEILG